MSGEDEAENLADRRSAPLISKPSADLFVKVALSAVVALLAWLLGVAYDGNREMGELAITLNQNTLATDRRITSLEVATDRRLTVLENRVDVIREARRE